MVGGCIDDIPSTDGRNTIFGNHYIILQSMVEIPGRYRCFITIRRNRIFIILAKMLKYVCFNLQERKQRSNQSLFLDER